MSKFVKTFSLVMATAATVLVLTACSNYKMDNEETNPCEKEMSKEASSDSGTLEHGIDSLTSQICLSEDAIMNGRKIVGESSKLKALQNTVKSAGEFKKTLNNDGKQSNTSKQETLTKSNKILKQLRRETIILNNEVNDAEASTK